MVSADERLRLASGPAAAPRGSASAAASRHRRHRRPWPHLQLRRSIVAALVQLDDDPVLLCDCADDAAHTCG